MLNNSYTWLLLFSWFWFPSLSLNAQSDVLGPSELWELATLRNPSILEADARVSEANSNAQGSNSVFLPEASFNGSAARNDSRLGADRTQYDSSGYSIDFSQSVLSRRDWTIRKQIQVGAEISRKEREVVRAAIRRDILLRYWSVLRYEESIDLINSSLNSHLDQLELQAKQAVAAGVRTSSDLSVNLLQIANLRLEVLRYQAELYENLEKLELLVGTPIKAVRPRLRGNQDPGLKSIPEGSKPSLEVETLRLESEAIGVEIASSGFWPKLDLRASYQSSMDLVQREPSNLKTQRRASSYGLTLNVPIFSGLSDFRIRQAAQFRLLAAEVRRNARTAELDLRKQSASRRVGLAYKRLQQGLSLVNNSLYLQAQVLKRQEAGVGSFDYVISPRVQVVELSLSCIATFYDYLSIVTAEYSDAGSLDTEIIEGFEKDILSSPGK